MGSSAGLTLTPSRSDLSETALCWALAKRGCWEVLLPFRPGGRSMGKPLPWLRRCPLPPCPDSWVAGSLQIPRPSLWGQVEVMGGGGVGGEGKGGPEKAARGDGERRGRQGEERKPEEGGGGGRGGGEAEELKVHSRRVTHSSAVQGREGGWRSCPSQEGQLP